MRKRISRRTALKTASGVPDTTPRWDAADRKVPNSPESRKLLKRTGRKGREMPGL